MPNTPPAESALRLLGSSDNFIRLLLPFRFREVTTHMPLHVVGVKVFAVGTVEWNIGSDCKCVGIRYFSCR